MSLFTERLTLRAIELRDIDAMLATRTIPDVVEFTYEPLWTREYAEERVSRWVALQQEEEVTFTRWMIELTATGEIMGDIFLSKDAELQGTTEIGYVIHPRHAGHGYATEAAREVLRIGFEEWGVHRIYARVDEDNIGSTRVCEHLGMRREARLLENDRRGEKWSTELVFAMLDSEWEEQKNLVTDTGLQLQPIAEFYASLPRRRVGSGFLITNLQGDILLLETTYKPNWEIPGGHADAGESPRVTAAHEVIEELGLAIEPGNLLVIDHVAEEMPKGDILAFVYDGGVIADPTTITIDNYEIRAAHFVPLTDVHKHVTPHMARRLHAAVRTRNEQRPFEIGSDMDDHV